jgi:hypothetical protein
MNKYRILLNGQNLLVYLEGSLQRLGFYTTRFVEGNTPDEARSIALDVIGKDAELKEMVFNDLDDPPVFLIEELKELNSDMELQTNPGFSFYVE